MTEKVDVISGFVQEEIRPLIKNHEILKDVVVWVKDFNEDSGTVSLGLALGSSTGCSPFCGCAASQIAELIGEELQVKFPEVKRAVGIAAIPEDEILTAWLNG
jgi:Fe-S cluster biogenesis protein NfuA